MTATKRTTTLQPLLPPPEQLRDIVTTRVTNRLAINRWISPPTKPTTRLEALYSSLFLQDESTHSTKLKRPNKAVRPLISKGAGGHTQISSGAVDTFSFI
eukprot:jgi/Psemu1/22018/gm1.22018_g